MQSRYSSSIFTKSLTSLWQFYLKEEEKEWDDIRYISWIRFLIGWIRGLEVYDKDSGIWGESHRQGNHVIAGSLLNECKVFFANNRN